MLALGFFLKGLIKADDVVAAAPGCDAVSITNAADVYFTMIMRLLFNYVCGQIGEVSLTCFLSVWGCCVLFPIVSVAAGVCCAGEVGEKMMRVNRFARMVVRTVRYHIMVLRVEVKLIGYSPPGDGSAKYAQRRKHGETVVRRDEGK